MITLTLPIAPVAKGRPRFTRQGHAYTPDKTRTFEQRLRAHLMGHADKPLEGALVLTLRFFLGPPGKKVREYPTVRPDVDNFAKGVMDAGNGLLWIDDSQIIKIDATKFYDWVNQMPRIELRVEHFKEEIEIKSEVKK